MKFIRKRGNMEVVSYSHSIFSATITGNEIGTIWEVKGTWLDNRHVKHSVSDKISIADFSALSDIDKENYALEIYYRALDFCNGGN